MAKRFSLTLFVAILVGVTAPAEAQLDLPVPKSTASDHSVTVSGCLDGTRLVPNSSTAASVSEILWASEFILDGPKEILDMLRKEHSGHDEEISGVAHLPADTSERRARIATRDVGKKGRVTVGKRQQSGGIRQGPQAVRLTVKSVRHLGDSCAGQRR